MLINLHIDEQDGEGYITETVEINVVPEIGDKLILSTSAIIAFQETYVGNTIISIENRTVEVVDKYISVKYTMIEHQETEMEIFSKLIEPIDELKF